MGDLIWNHLLPRLLSKTATRKDAPLQQTYCRLPPARRPMISRRHLMATGIAGLTVPAMADEAEMLTAIDSDFGKPQLISGKIEIAMPEFSDSGSSVPMDIRVPCAMTQEDYPHVVRVYAPRNPRPRLVALYFTPNCGEARLSTRVRLGSFQDVVAIAQMVDGTTFQAIRRVNVTYGACETAVANDQFPPGWHPSIRIAAPENVARNEIFTVRTIINHPMETGLRHANTGLLIPLRIAERFRCLANGNEVFSAKLEPAIAANPYLAFSLRLTESSRLDFEWVDTNGEIFSARRDVSVV